MRPVSPGFQSQVCEDLGVVTADGPVSSAVVRIIKPPLRVHRKLSDGENAMETSCLVQQMNTGMESGVWSVGLLGLDRIPTMKPGIGI